LVVGHQPDYDVEPPDPTWYLASHPVELCGWCKIGTDLIEDELSLQRALAAAGARSTSWSWR
jgi:hypothetical protein